MWALAMLCAAGTALAQEGVVERARALQAQGQQEQAFALLDAQEAEQAGKPAFDRALAQAAEASGLYTRALLAWERVLQAEPGDVSAQDGQARLLQVLGDWRALQALPLEVRQRSTAVGAALQTDPFLYTYDRWGSAGQSSLHGAVDFGVGRDSNVNAGIDPDTNFPTLPGVPAWSLDPSAWARSSSQVSAALTLRGRYVFTPQWSLVGGLFMEGRRYRGAAAADEPTLADAHLGLAWRANRHEWIVTGRGIHEGRDGRQARGSGALQAEWIYRLDGLNQIGAFAQTLQMHYPGQPLRDARRNVLGLNYAAVLRSGSILYAGLYAGDEKPRGAGAGLADLGHRLLGARVGGQWALHPRWALFASLDGERRRFGAVDPFFLLPRRDTQWRASLGLSWVPAPQWRITTQMEWIDVDSSVPIYPYQRRLVSIVVRREF